MPTFTVYKTESCPYCQSAMQFLGALKESRDDVQVKLVDANAEAARFKKVAATVGRSTVPQIFIDGHYVGGWDDLTKAAKLGQLDAYLDGGEWQIPEATPRAGFWKRIAGRA